MTEGRTMFQPALVVPSAWLIYLLALPAAAVLEVWVRHRRNFYNREIAVPVGKKWRAPKSTSP